MAGGEAKEKTKGKSKGKEAAARAAAADDGGAAAEAAREATLEGRRLLDVALDLGVRHAAAAAALLAEEASRGCSGAPRSALTRGRCVAAQVLSRAKAAAPRELLPSNGAAAGRARAASARRRRCAAPATAEGPVACAHARRRQRCSRPPDATCRRAPLRARTGAPRRAAGSAR